MEQQFGISCVCVWVWIKSSDWPHLWINLPQPRALAWALAWSQLPSAPGGFGVEWGWALSLCQAFLWPWRQCQWPEGIVRAREEMIIFFPRQASLSAGIMQSCHCPSPLKGSPVWLECCFNPIPLCAQFPSFQPSRSNPTPRLPIPLTRTSPLNVKPEETPSPREYCLEKQTEAELAFNLCQALLCLSGAAAQNPAHHPQRG